MKVFFCLSVLIGMTLPAESAYNFDVWWQEQSGYRVGGANKEYGWNYKYDIGFFSNTLKVDIDIALIGDDPGDTLRNRWENGIESIWSTDKYRVPITFNVDWVGADEADQVVTVKSGDGRDDMVTWYTGNPAGWGDAYQDEVAAHEYGHMLGLYDEYVGGAVNPETLLTGTGGLMETLNGPTLKHYYDPFFSWYTAVTPEPLSMLLYGLGAFIFAVFKRKNSFNP